MADRPVRTRAVGSLGRRWPLRMLSTVILVVLGGAVAASCVITLNATRDQERLILQERTGEAAAVLGSAFSGVQDSLRLVGSVAGSNPVHPRSFARAARSVLTAPGPGLLVTAQRGASMRVIAAAGAAPAVGQAIPGAQAQLGRRALSTTGMVSGLVRQGGRRWLEFALGGGAGPGTVVWEESPVSQVTLARPSPASPFGYLDIALYLSARPEASTLIAATTKHLPLAGLQYPFRVGHDTWLLVAASTSPLVGRLAEDTPWIILVIGGLAVALTVTVVEALGRRRDYAATQVRERTASLETAMAELQAAQSQLVRQEKLAAVGQLASTVGHELRNPLGVIMNVLYLLEVAAGENDLVRRHLATAKRETTAATLIVSDLLDYSAGREPMLTAVPVADLISEALSVVPSPAGVEVAERSDPELVITADRDQLRQALLNLITNGFEAMPDGGTLTVSAASAGGSVKITVTDTGIGMSAETRQNIFTPFFTGKVRGIGLGLAVTKRVVEAHGGTITVASTPSVGSSFTITVPAVALASVPR
jgi:two-component system, NtrC family, sensor histidine kinase HydH